MGQTEVIPSMTLLLKRTPAQQAQLNSYAASLSSPGSPNYHKWLTAKQLGEQFGPNDQDIATVEKWLQSQGLGIKSISADKMMIHISGPVAAVERAFGTNDASLRRKRQNAFRQCHRAEATHRTDSRSGRNCVAFGFLPQVAGYQCRYGQAQCEGAMGIGGRSVVELQHRLRRQHVL